MPLDNNPPPVSEIMAGSGEHEFNLAFVLDAGGCTPAWDGSASELVATDTTVPPRSTRSARRPATSPCRSAASTGTWACN